MGTSKSFGGMPCPVHPRKGRVVLVPTSPCPVGIGSLALRTDTLFTRAPQKGTGVSIYLVIVYGLIVGVTINNVILINATCSLYIYIIS